MRFFRVLWLRNQLCIFSTASSFPTIFDLVSLRILYLYPLTKRELHLPINISKLCTSVYYKMFSNPLYYYSELLRNLQGAEKLYNEWTKNANNGYSIDSSSMRTLSSSMYIKDLSCGPLPNYFYCVICRGDKRTRIC